MDEKPMPCRCPVDALCCPEPCPIIGKEDVDRIYDLKESVEKLMGSRDAGKQGRKRRRAAPRRRETPAKHAERVLISNTLLCAARDRAFEIGQLKGSFTKGRGMLVGLVGQNLARERLRGVGLDTSDFDFRLPDGRMVEVKTKKCGSPPMGHYWCSVSEGSKHQQPDLYVFARVRNDFSEGWLLGWMTRERFDREARYFKKGELDPLGGKWPFAANCYNVIADSLEPISILDAQPALVTESKLQ